MSERETFVRVYELKRKIVIAKKSFKQLNGIISVLWCMSSRTQNCSNEYIKIREK